MSESYDFLWSLDRRMRGPEFRMGMATVKGYGLDGYTNTDALFAFIVPAANDWISAEHIPARVATEYPPRPGAAVWYGTDGNDYYVMGILGPDGPPTALTTLTGDTTITTGASTATFPGMTIFDDPWNMVDSTGTAIRIPVSGLYSVYAQPGWNTGTVGYRNVAIYRNNGIIVRDRAVPVNAAMFHVVSRSPAYFDAGDLLSVGVFHTQGADLVLSSMQFGVTWIGNQRTTGQGNAISSQRYPNGSISAWDTTLATTSTETIETKLGQPSLTFTTTAGTNTNTVYSPEVFPVVPRQRFTVAGSAQTSVILGAAEGLVMFLLCSAEGTPNPALTSSSASTGFSTATVGVANSYTAISNGEQIIPDGCYTARLAIRVQSTAVKVISFTNLSVTEKVY
jgi:hypothetical protein